MNSSSATGGAGKAHLNYKEMEVCESSELPTDVWGTGGGGDLTTSVIFALETSGIGGGAGYSLGDYIKAVRGYYTKKSLDITSEIDANITKLYYLLCGETSSFKIQPTEEIDILFETVFRPLSNAKFEFVYDDPNLRYMTLLEEYRTSKLSGKPLFVHYSTKSGKFDEITASAKAIKSIMGPNNRFIDVGADILKPDELKTRDGSVLVGGVSGVVEGKKLELDIIGPGADAHDELSNVLRRLRYLHNKIVKAGYTGFETYGSTSPIVKEIIMKFEKYSHIAGNILDAGRATGNFIEAVKRTAIPSEESAEAILIDYLNKFIFLRFDAKAAGRKEAIQADIELFLKGEASHIILLNGNVSTREERAKRILEEFSSVYRLNITSAIAPIVLEYYSLGEDPSLVADPKISEKLQTFLATL
jgi:hypothetical protein